MREGDRSNCGKAALVNKVVTALMSGLPFKTSFKNGVELVKGFLDAAIDLEHRRGCQRPTGKTPPQQWRLFPIRRYPENEARLDDHVIGKRPLVQGQWPRPGSP